MDPSESIPVMLSVAGRRCIVVGGGAVGCRRAKSLAEAGAQVVVIALQVDPSLKQSGLNVEERAFTPTDLDGALLVVAATDRPEVNDAVSQAAAERGVPINRADDPGNSDLTFMTSHRDGPLTVAVHTGGASAAAAVKIRDLLAGQLDPDWAKLLALALPVRQAIQQRVKDPATRTALLRRLSDQDAMATLKAGGDSALKARYGDIMRDLA